MTWHLLTTMVLEKLLLADYGLEVVTSVMWTPVVSTEGSLSQDRFAIGTIGHKAYTDILPELLFATPRPSPCLFALNGYMCRFGPLMHSPRTPPSFPMVDVELALVRGETLTLDFIRDLLGNMDIPAPEILDISFQQDQIGIFCASLPTAAVIFQCAREYLTHGDEWNIIPNSKCILPDKDLPSYAALSKAQPESPYPAAIVDPVLIRARISPISSTSKVPPAEVPLQQPKPRPGVRVSTLKTVPRPPPTPSMLSINLSNLTVSETRDPSPKRRRDQDSLLVQWVDLLEGVSMISEDQIHLLSTVLRRHLPTSFSLRRALVGLLSQEKESSAHGDDNMMCDSDA
jgi:hypothetical protein